MYHSVIGKRLVECASRCRGTPPDVREFFVTVYVPLFFGSQRLLQNVNNSPFDQVFTKQKKPFSPEMLARCLDDVHRKIAGQEPDASFFLGGPAAGFVETTSGQVTAMHIPTSAEDVYASWIGAAAGLTVQGGLSILVDAEDVLLATYDGWLRYRRVLDQAAGLKPLQVNTWNGQWVTHALGRSEDAFFDPIKTSDGTALETQRWVGLLFALSRHYRGSAVGALCAYVYALGQSNKTIGFVRFSLSEVLRPVELYQQLFTVPEGMPPYSFTELYDTADSFEAACKLLAIGLRAIKPRDVFKGEVAVPAAPSAADPKRLLAFQTFEVWIAAMLNNKDLYVRAGSVAERLAVFASSGERGKTGRSNAVKTLLDKRNRRDFIDALTDLVQQEDTGPGDTWNGLVEEMLSLSPDNVALFLTLLRFRYAAAQRQTGGQ